MEEAEGWLRGPLSEQRWERRTAGKQRPTPQLADFTLRCLSSNASNSSNATRTTLKSAIYEQKQRGTCKKLNITLHAHWTSCDDIKPEHGKTSEQLCNTHPPIAGNEVVKAPVDLLQFGDENIHATLTGFCEEILRERQVEEQLKYSTVDVKKSRGRKKKLVRP